MLTTTTFLSTFQDRRQVLQRSLEPLQPFLVFFLPLSFHLPIWVSEKVTLKMNPSQMEVFTTTLGHGPFCGYNGFTMNRFHECTSVMLENLFKSSVMLPLALLHSRFERLIFSGIGFGSSSEIILAIKMASCLPQQRSL